MSRTAGRRTAGVLPALLMAAAGCAPPDPPTPATTAVLAQVIDGDTIDVVGLGRVRLIGIDSPESDACGYEPATEHLVDLLASGDLLLSRSPGLDDTDPYGRLLRYVDLPDGGDAGLAQLVAGWARTAYDSTQGYPAHAREATYQTADAGSEDRGCYPD
jgi:endonuclease YncB( thermonuclease family)